MNSEFARTVEGSRSRLLAFVRHIVCDNAVAEDIVQDAVFAALKTMEGGTHIVNPEAWLLKVARNKALDTVRSAGFSRSLPMDAARMHESCSDPERHLGMKDRIRQVEKVVETLPELQRTAFVLRDVLGYPMEEMVEVLDCSPENARQLVSRARKAIRKYLLENE